MISTIIVSVLAISLISILITVAHFMPYSGNSNNNNNNNANIYESIKAPSHGHKGVASTLSFLTYRDPIYGIKIQYPSNWEKVQFAKNFIAGFVSTSTNDSGILENVMISTARLPYPISLDHLGNARISSDKSNYLGFHLISSGQTISHAGIPLYRIEYTHNIGALPVTTLEIWTIRGNSAFRVLSNLDSPEFSVYMPVIQKMIDSFGTIATSASPQIKLRSV